MNDQISWDPSLVKKFSSSNHFKLLNQLRSEVKKYPLTNKQIRASIEKKDNIHDPKSKESILHVQNCTYSNNNIDANRNKSTVSFNNSKNFSIYNNVSHETNRPYKESDFLEEGKSKEELSSSTFNDRPN